MTNLLPAMSFAEFQATKADCADLGKAIGDETIDGVPGYLYADSLYIERLADGSFHLLIERDEWLSETIEELEEHLFAFGVLMGYFTDKDAKPAPARKANHEEMIFIRNKWEIVRIELNPDSGVEQFIRRDYSFVCIVGQEQARMPMPVKPLKV